MEASTKRLLVLDDEDEARTSLARHFGSVGYAVDATESVPEALAKVRTGLDAVFSEIRLSNGSGIEFLQQARRIDPALGVFVITGHAALDTLIAAKAHGARAYFRKPLNFAAVEARLRAHFGDDAASVIQGRTLVIGHTLMEKLGDRVLGVQPLVCDAAESAFLQTVGEHRPKAVLADAGAPETPDLLQAYQRLGGEANSFLLVADETAVDAAKDLLFGQGAAGCVPLEAPREQVERVIREAVELREAQKLDQQSRVEEQTHKCMFAKAYRNGYYCLKQGPCPYGPLQAGWIATEGKEYQKCAKRPLLVTSLKQVGFATWSGEIDPVRAFEVRKHLRALLRERKQEIVIDAQALKTAHYNLFEILSDVYGELAKIHPDGLIHVINLTPALQEEFRRGVINKGVRFYGIRMVDERSAFARWGTRFE